MPVSRRIFLIDDDPDDQDIFIMTLRDINKEMVCETADNGVKAIEKLNSAGYPVPDFIFIDFNMPKMNGLDCLKIIRATDKFRNSKVIMYSTTSESRMVVLSKKLGADDFLMKPSGLEELKNRLTGILSN